MKIFFFRILFRALFSTGLVLLGLTGEALAQAVGQPRPAATTQTTGAASIAAAL